MRYDKVTLVEGEDDKNIVHKKDIITINEGNILGNDFKLIAEKRNNGEFRNLGVWLNPVYNYRIVEDNIGSIVLLTLKR